jgi:hypothetical protein
MKNHSPAAMSFLATLRVFNAAGVPIITQGPRNVTIPGNTVFDYTWTRPVPPNAPPGMYYIQTVVTDNSMYEIHEDWCVVEV